MNCEQMMESMQRFVDEDLTQTEEQILMTHISQCPDCAASFEQLQRLSAELSLLPMVVPPFSIVDSILPRLAELDAQQAAIHVAYLPTVNQRKKPLFSWKIAAGFVAAAVIFALIAVNLEPINKFNAGEMMKSGSASKDTANYKIADEAIGREATKAIPEAKSVKPTADNSVHGDKVTKVFNEEIPTEKDLSSSSSKSPTVSADATSYTEETLRKSDDASKSQELAPQPSPTPVPKITAPAVNDKNLMFTTANQTLATDDGNFIGVVERQIVQVQTPDGNRIYTSSITWKSTDTIRLLLWQDNQRLTYEVKMEDGLVKRFIVDPILKTEQEQKIN